MLFSKLDDYYRRFKIPVDEKEEFYKFRERIYELLKGDVLDSLSRNYKRKGLFGLLVGRPDQEPSTLFNWFIRQADNLPALLLALENLFAVFEDEDNARTVDHIYELVDFALKISPLIGVDIGRGANGVVFFPKGAEVLDPALIEDVLNWLSDYPDVNKHYTEALRLYLVNDPNVYRNLLDNLRLSLELFLKALLQNDVRLEEQAKPLRDWLIEREVQENLRMMFTETLGRGRFTDLMNTAVKHGDRPWHQAEVEFLIYQTGVFIRFLI